MMKNTAIPASVIASGNEEEMKKYGAQRMDQDELSQRNADQVAHEEYKETKQYRDVRAMEYPSVGEQLDAIWKFIEALRVELRVTIPEEVLEMIERIDAVKEKYPKPGAK